MEEADDDNTPYRDNLKLYDTSLFWEM